MNHLAKRIAVLAAGHGAVDFYLPVISAALPVLLPFFAAQGITSYAMAGFLVTIINIIPAVVQPVAGWIQDRGGWTLGTSWCVLMTAVAISCFAFVQNYWLLLGLAVVAGIGNSLFHPNAYQQIYQFSTPTNRGTLLSLFSIGGSFGYGAAPLVVGALLVWAGLPALIYLIIPGIIVAFIISRFPQKPMHEPAVADPSVSGGSANWRCAGLMLGLSSLRTWVYYGFLAFATVYLTTYAGVEYFVATLFVTGMFYAGMIATLVAAVSSDKVGRKEVLLISYACSVPAYLGIFLLPAPFSLLSLLAAGFFLMAPATIEIATVQEMMPGSVGLASGIVIGIPLGVSAFASLVIGVLADIVGSMPEVLMMQAILMAATVVLCIFLPYPLKLWSR
ncbi:MAG: MFS transporter [Methanocorpusculum sp.]|nr:MFS transporter [Methanocorpusculum sp.]